MFGWTVSDAMMAMQTNSMPAATTALWRAAAMVCNDVISPQNKRALKNVTTVIGWTPMVVPKGA